MSVVGKGIGGVFLDRLFVAAQGLGCPSSRPVEPEVTPLKIQMVRVQVVRVPDDFQSDCRRWDISFSSGTSELTKCLICDVVGLAARYSTALTSGRMRPCCTWAATTHDDGPTRLFAMRSARSRSSPPPLWTLACSSFG